MLDASFGASHGMSMPADEKDSKDHDAQREAKLAQALRANLRRRKAGAATSPKPDADRKTGDKA
jgi:hypothetical protein